MHGMPALQSLDLRRVPTGWTNLYKRMFPSPGRGEASGNKVRFSTALSHGVVNRAVYGVDTWPGACRRHKCLTRAGLCQRRWFGAEPSTVNPLPRPVRQSLLYFRRRLPRPDRRGPGTLHPGHRFIVPDRTTYRPCVRRSRTRPVTPGLHGPGQPALFASKGGPFSLAPLALLATLLPGTPPGTTGHDKSQAAKVAKQTRVGHL
jgi:hypothetical protein